MLHHQPFPLAKFRWQNFSHGLLCGAFLLLCASGARAQFATNVGWSDEFSTNGLPDPAKWGYETGGGGWGNSELEYYTARSTNARVQNGFLTINALQENYGGSAYTSARLHSLGEGDWKYGRIEPNRTSPLRKAVMLLLTAEPNWKLERSMDFDGMSSNAM